jgi:hypothetical protein
MNQSSFDKCTTCGWLRCAHNSPGSLACSTFTTEVSRECDLCHRTRDAHTIDKPCPSFKARCNNCGSQRNKHTLTPDGSRWCKNNETRFQAAVLTGEVKQLDSYCKLCLEDTLRFIKWSEEGGEMPELECTIEHRIPCKVCQELIEPDTKSGTCDDCYGILRRKRIAERTERTLAKKTASK